MEYSLTDHARESLVKRKIPVEWMEKALFSPEWIERDTVDQELEHRLAHIPDFADRVLRVF